MTRRPACIGVAVLVLLWAARVAAEPAPAEGKVRVYRISDTFKVTLQSGTVRDMPPSLIVPMQSWAAIDTEMKRLQDTEVRLSAERDSLVSSAEADGPGWGTVALIIGAFAAGTAAARVVY